MYFIGLMSGTSADGIDASLLKFSDAGFSHIASIGIEFNTVLRQKILTLYNSSEHEIEQQGCVAHELAQAYAQACQTLLAQTQLTANQICAIGCHGQTIRHRPTQTRPFSLQITDYALLAELTQIDVIGDFRSADIAAGGQGAPLVPAFHQALFQLNQDTSVSAINPKAKNPKNQTIVNIGGIANITFLPAHTANHIIGFDTGPGNCLMDAWCEKYQAQPYDKAGQWAATGDIQFSLLQSLLKHPYFALATPKSTGREIFNLDWLNNLLQQLEINNKIKYKAEDVQATLLALTSKSITEAIKHIQPNGAVWICGGGVFNPVLMQQIQNDLGENYQVCTTASMDIDPNWIESQCFAWLAHRFIQRMPANIPSVTGAKKPKILGCLYPH